MNMQLKIFSTNFALCVLNNFERNRIDVKIYYSQIEISDRVFYHVIKISSISQMVRCQMGMRIAELHFCY